MTAVPPPGPPHRRRRRPHRRPRHRPHPTVAVALTLDPRDLAAADRAVPGAPLVAAHRPRPPSPNKPLLSCHPSRPLHERESPRGPSFPRAVAVDLPTASHPSRRRPSTSPPTPLTGVTQHPAPTTQRPLPPTRHPPETTQHPSKKFFAPRGSRQGARGRPPPGGRRGVGVRVGRGRSWAVVGGGGAGGPRPAGRGTRAGRRGEGVDGVSEGSGSRAGPDRRRRRRAGSPAGDPVG